MSKSHLKIQNNLKAHRGSSCLDYLSIETGISKGTLSMLENGLTVPLLSTAYEIAETLGVTVESIWPPGEMRAAQTRRFSGTKLNKSNVPRSNDGKR